MRYAITALAAAVMLTGFAHAQNATEGQAPAKRLAETCAALGNNDTVCQCLIREAASRFDRPHLAVIADAAARHESLGEIGTGLSNAGYREAEIRSFLARIQAADTVISQTCGATLISGEPS